MVRVLEARDVPALEALRGRNPLGSFRWEMGRPDFLGALVFADGQDVPRIVMGAFARAEIHMAMDHAWATPAERLQAGTEVHEAMMRGLQARGVGAVATWFDDRMKGFGRRLVGLGWTQCKDSSWHRKVA